MKNPLRSITFKIVLIILAVFAVFVACVRQAGLSNIMRTIEDEVEAEVLSNAQVLAQRLDAERLAAWGEGKSDKGYAETARTVDELRHATGSDIMYVTRLDPKDPKRVSFVFASESDDDGLRYPTFERGDSLALTDENGIAAYEYLYDGTYNDVSMFGDNDIDPGKARVTGMVSIKDRDGRVQGVACAQRILADGFAIGEGYTENILAQSLQLALIGLLVLVLFLHRSIVHPLSQIAFESERFAVSHIPAEESLGHRLRKRDEIGSLACAFDQMEEQLHKYLGVLVEVTAQNERIGAELELAKRIQADMLPNIFPAFPMRPEFDIHASMEPAKEVGGDFYNFFLVDDDHLCMMIADVSGKGVPAALFMMSAMIILANYARMGNAPNDVLRLANDTICANNREQMFVTVWLGVLEISTGRLIAASAGHEYPFLMHADGDFELYEDVHGFVLGGMEGMEYSCYEVDMRPGSKFFVYTDGVPEATNAVAEAFGNNRLQRALNHDVHASPEQILGFVRQDVLEFVGDAEQFDDLTMLCLEYRGNAT